MIRTQVYLTEQQVAALKERSTQQGVSVAEVIRQAIDQYLHLYLTKPRIITEEQRRRALAFVGSFSDDVTDLSENHDQYLAEIYAQVAPMNPEIDDDSATSE